MVTNKLQLFWFIYLFLIRPTCFGRYFRPSSGALDCIYSFWYCPTILMLAGVIDEMELTYSQFHLIHQWTVSEAVNTVKCSWWWAKTSPETCRADRVQINKPKICIFLVINYESLPSLPQGLIASISKPKFCQWIWTNQFVTKPTKIYKMS
jgi:hypothetical protein